MHRKKLVRLLEGYTPTHEPEAGYKLQFLEFVRGNPECFERSLDEGHVCCSSWLENRSCTRFLLTKHWIAGEWFQLGGHADGDEDVLRGSLREAHEESGLANISPVSLEVFDLGIYSIPRYGEVPAHIHYDVCFWLRTEDRDEYIRISKESLDLRWFTSPPTTNLAVNRLFSKWKNLRQIYA
ncbi:MAG: NUDIX domain-containing protein [Puniceicoccales bacterium]|jgi:ADP-ribose pyrophosphatase YjhB (NUDIX family)|nr:NUDIX domain-containing protein [Puniceicoccales bacterium]